MVVGLVSRATLGLGLLSLGGCAAFLFRALKSRGGAPQKCSYVSRSGKLLTLDKPRWCDERASADDEPEPLMLTRLPGITRRQIRKDVRSLWRYAAAFPFACADPITLGEGCTPLVRRPFAGSSNVLFKCEWCNPTCSFKDRGTTVMLSLLRQQGVTNVLEDSSGNGGASVACYAAAGGLQATIMAPSSTAPAKTVAMRAHGAAVELIPGSRQATADAAVAAHGRGGDLFYASHNWHPFFLQGTKTIAYEIWEDLGFAAPDNIIIPSGAGSNILGCDLGFSELLGRREIAKLPRLFCAQPLLCSPIATAILDELEEDDGQSPPCGGVANAARKGPPPSDAWNVPTKTMAEGTSIARPVRLAECVEAVVRSGGGAVRVTEAQISDATFALAKLGLYTEPTCAQAAAAYETLLASGKVRADETTVIILTSTGVKATPSIAGLLGLPV
jgi:threonine synthase